MIKDEEIDLTEHRDFRGENNSPRFITRNGETYSNIGSYINRIVRKDLYGDNPWEVIPREKYFEYDGLLALGNKEQRKRAVEARCWGTKDNKICDCCGREYIKIPWRIDWGLCNNCSERTSDKKSFSERFNWIRIGG